MKLVLDREELFTLLLAALAEKGFTNVTDFKIDIGEGAALSLNDIQGLLVTLS